MILCSAGSVWDQRWVFEPTLTSVGCVHRLFDSFGIRNVYLYWLNIFFAAKQLADESKNGSIHAWAEGFVEKGDVDGKICFDEINDVIKWLDDIDNQHVK